MVLELRAAPGTEEALISMFAEQMINLPGSTAPLRVPITL